ncbi:L-type lectin-domain containing receptor kinase IX.1-like [Quercus lobata]|uniref:L-type lectin-domain containing receptor kinase IX.1-like n=1 Tax=Quercus lobata TaxID=97700 RepID=UPI0012486F3B|nr:L-type lectin-domain containing receptor kinase IX.1-like [Quercus lobata]
MALSNVPFCLVQPPQKLQFLFNQLFIFFLLLLPNAMSISFNFPSFSTDNSNLILKGDADTKPDGRLHLTKDTLDGSISGSVGRALYHERVHLWDNSTGKLKVADFTTNFSFIIKAVDNHTADGLAFFISPFNSSIPNNSGGRYLGLFSNETAINGTQNQIVAVEFDTFGNEDWPRDTSAPHVGIDINSIVSKVNVTLPRSINITNGSTTYVWVSYDSASQNLSVFLTYATKPAYSWNSISLSYIVDFTILPEWVSVGFSATTGASVELHTILSWSFNSTLEAGDVTKNKLGLIIGLAVSSGVVSCGIGLLWFLCWRKRAGGNTEESGDDDNMDDEFEKGTGPRRFTYRELLNATNNFVERGKLGEGGFGGVYKGLLSESNVEVAVKRVSKGSKQGKKEYKSEVKIIGRLRHRNLVQLIGWCHEQRELLLVYGYMPNGSLDSHLFGAKIMLKWPIRYKIAQGLTSALLYLHEEWEQCVVHRDIKSSNIMLDSNFNAKLGDFGLARLVDHELGLQTTVVAGTMGYLAPECFTTGTASKESDVYSFGVVCLEIACGRKPVDPRTEPSKVRLLEWVWDLYGNGQLLEAIDKRLGMEFDEGQIKSLMVVGLWCCHPNPTSRPSIRQVIHVLNFEASLPNLPSKLPVPMYVGAPMDLCKLSNTSSGFTRSKDQTKCSSGSCSTYTSMSTGPSKPLLYSSKAKVELIWLLSGLLKIVFKIAVFVSPDPNAEKAVVPKEDILDFELPPEPSNARHVEGH